MAQHLLDNFRMSALRERNITPESFDALFLGLTVIAEHRFYGAPCLAELIGVAGLEKRQLPSVFVSLSCRRERPPQAPFW